LFSFVRFNLNKMKKILSVLLLLTITTIAMAQKTGYSFVANKKTIKGNFDSPPTIVVLKKELAKPSTIKFYFEGDLAMADYKTSIMVMDDKDSTIAQFEGNADAAINIVLAKMKKTLMEKTSLKIYSLSIPKDPEMASRVRVARKLLATIVLKEK
jgi:hypothetical protein